jgi:predicted DNA-binding transcriptional regulator AlpA
MTEFTGKQLGLTAVRGKLLTTKEIAAFLRVSVRWVNSHMVDGTFPFRWFLIGERNHVADSADLNGWLEKVVIEAGTAPLPLKAVRKIQKVEGSPM